MAVVEGAVPVRGVGDGETVLTHDMGRAGDVRELGVRWRRVGGSVEEPFCVRRDAGIGGERSRREHRRQVPSPGIALAPRGVVVRRVGAEVRDTCVRQAVRRAEQVILMATLFHRG